MREKADALLKITEVQVAEQGLLQTHDPDGIYRWLKRWQTQGIAGLVVQTGRGRKAVFFPEYATPEEAKAGLLEYVHQAPENFKQIGSRW